MILQTTLWCSISMIACGSSVIAGSPTTIQLPIKIISSFILREIARVNIHFEVTSQIIVTRSAHIFVACITTVVDKIAHLRRINTSRITTTIEMKWKIKIAFLRTPINEKHKRIMTITITNCSILPQYDEKVPYLGYILLGYISIP